VRLIKKEEITTDRRPHLVIRFSCSQELEFQPKRKAKELLSSDCLSESTNRRHGPRHSFDDCSAVQDTSDERAAQSSRQLGLTEGGLAYATGAAGHAVTEQPSGTHKSQAKDSSLPQPVTQ
jgi:hypothetical protein